jgi:hypothetical protein
LNSGDFEDIENPNLKAVIEVYDEWISKFDEDELDVFYHKLINIAVIIRLDVTLAEDAYKLFETINNRGLKLSATDIIKNFLLGHASKLNDPYVLEQVKNLWAQIIKDLDGLNTDNFFRQYFCSLLIRKITFNGLVDEFKAYYIKNVEYADLLGEYEVYTSEENSDDEEENFSDDKPLNRKRDSFNDKESRISIIEFLKLIRNASEVYSKISNRKFAEVWINQHILNLVRIQSFPSYIFLMHFLQKQYSKKMKIIVLKMIETFMLRRHTCARSTGENDFIFAHSMNSLLETEEEDIIDKIKKEFVEYYPSDTEFEDKLPSYDFKGKVEDRARYILENIEYDLRGNTKETLISSKADVHLEHIIPQTISTKKAINEYGDWIKYLGDKALVKHKKYVGRIGNLTLLAAPLNIKAYNNPFLNKKDSYRASELKITQELATKSQFTFYNVDKRGEEITQKAVKIWAIDFSEIEEE